MDRLPLRSLKKALGWLGADLSGQGTSTRSRGRGGMEAEPARFDAQASASQAASPKPPVPAPKHCEGSGCEGPMAGARGPRVLPARDALVRVSTRSRGGDPAARAHRRTRVPKGRVREAGGAADMAGSPRGRPGVDARTLEQEAPSASLPKPGDPRESEASAGRPDVWALLPLWEIARLPTRAMTFLPGHRGL